DLNQAHPLLTASGLGGVCAERTRTEHVPAVANREAFAARVPSADVFVDVVIAVVVESITDLDLLDAGVDSRGSSPSGGVGRRGIVRGDVRRHRLGGRVLRAGVRIRLATAAAGIGSTRRRALGRLAPTRRGS